MRAQTGCSAAKRGSEHHNFGKNKFMQHLLGTYYVPGMALDVAILSKVTQRARKGKKSTLSKEVNQLHGLGKSA